MATSSLGADLKRQFGSSFRFETGPNWMLPVESARRYTAARTSSGAKARGISRTTSFCSSKECPLSLATRVYRGQRCTTIQI